MTAAAIWHAHFGYRVGERSDDDLARLATQSTSFSDRDPLICAVREEQARRRYRAVWGMGHWDPARQCIQRVTHVHMALAA